MEAEKQSFDVDVAVVGAGPVGLLLALELHRHGVTSLTVLEQRPEPELQDKSKSKAVAVHARSMELLEDMGLLPAFLEQGLSCTTVRVLDEGDLLFEANLEKAVQSRHNAVLCLPQYDTETILQEQCRRQGIDVRYSTTVADVVTNDHEALISFQTDRSDSETLRAKWVVACDGGHSAVKRSLDMVFEGEDLRIKFTMADVKITSDDLPHGILFGALSNRGMTFLFPEPGSRARLVMLFSDPEEEAKTQEELTLEFFDKELRRRIPDANFDMSEPHWLTTFTVRQRMLQHFRKDRVLFAGDAAHTHSPVGGMGMNTGLQDAYNLAWKLALVARGMARDSLLDSYEAERVPVVKDLLLGTGLGTKALAKINHPAARLLRWAAKNVGIAPLVNRLTVGAVGMTNIAYPASPLNSLDVSPSGLGWIQASHVAPGSRAPDSAVTTASGEETTLLQLFTGIHFTAVVFPATEGDPSCEEALAIAAEAPRDLVAPLLLVHSREALPPSAHLPCPVAWDVACVAREEYGVRPGSACLVLVRPDGHVCLVQQPARTGGIQAYLASHVLL